MNYYSKPNVLGIGLAKTGTTWLARNLRNHPDIDLPSIKEVKILAEDLLVPRKGFLARIFSKHSYYRYDRGRIKKAIRRLHKQKTNKKKEVMWLLKYIFSKRSSEFYTSLFDARPEKISIDISPIYARLSEEHVTKIAQQFPDLKIILFLREPVDRSWSHLRMVFANKRGRNINKVKDGEFLDFFKELEKFFLDYVDIAKRWEKHFPGRVFISCSLISSNEIPKTFMIDFQFFGITPVKRNIEWLGKSIMKLLRQGLSRKQQKTTQAYE